MANIISKLKEDKPDAGEPVAVNTEIAQELKITETFNDEVPKGNSRINKPCDEDHNQAPRKAKSGKRKANNSKESGNAKKCKAHASPSNERNGNSANADTSATPEPNTAGCSTASHPIIDQQKADYTESHLDFNISCSQFQSSADNNGMEQSASQFAMVGSTDLIDGHIKQVEVSNHGFCCKMTFKK